MSSIYLKNVTIPGGEGETSVSLRVSDGIIAEISGTQSNGDSIDLSGARMFPGFIDIHNHGAAGIDVNEADSEGLLEVGRFLLRHGVTSWVPTIVPDSEDRYRKIIDSVDGARQSGARDSAEIVGVHYEGLFSNRKVCGALRPEYFREYRSGDLEKLPSASGIPHIFTFAPEVDGSLQLVEDLLDRKWIPSIGHTDASPVDLEQVYSKGVRQVTHLFNAMSGLHHRGLGVVGWSLSKSDVSCELIADGVHVADEILGVTFRAKGSERLMLVSDSIAPTGLGDGEFEIWGEKITVDEKKTQNARGSIAGSVITLEDAVHRMSAIGARQNDLSRMASANQAEMLGLGDRGEIAVGRKADLVAVDQAGNICFVMKSGEVIHSAV
jgi:N-acetylglucosamine-6-phosphate deacetylase